MKLLTFSLILAFALVDLVLAGILDNSVAYDDFENGIDSFSLHHYNTKKLQQNNPDADLNVPQLIRKYGYECEEHIVTTEDGYILTLHRIPRGRNSGNNPVKRPVIFLQHGFLASSADWIENTVEKSLGYELADRQYDVWLGNARGNTYSRNHTSLEPSDRKFWNFSYHEMGNYDIPAVIDYILETTMQEKLYYVGHSMGTAMFWITMSLHPEYNSKIQLMIALAPIAYVQNMRSPIRLLAPYATEAQILEMLFGDREFLPHAGFVEVFRKIVCDHEPLKDAICENIVFLMSGFDRAQLNQSMVSVILGHTPAGASTKTVIHFAQGINSGEFRQFDYGKKQNEIMYGQDNPPNYNISEVTAPVALYWGENDWLADKKDVLRLASVLPNMVQNYRVDYEKFTHLDFLFAIDVNKLLYNDIFKLLEKHYTE